ncbi:MAG: hypothetical protein R6V59_06215 [Dehalococcoidia bacterium]
MLQRLQRFISGVFLLSALECAADQFGCLKFFQVSCQGSVADADFSGEGCWLIPELVSIVEDTAGAQEVSSFLNGRVSLSDSIVFS